MKRTWMIFLGAFMAFTSLSFATVTRTKTMGRVEHFVYDDANIFSWPSTVVGFTDRFLLELGEGVFGGGYNPAMIGPSFPAGFGGGGLFAINEFHNLGFFVTGNDRANGGGTTDAFFPDGLAIDDYVTLWYGYGAENLDFGASLNIGKARTETKAPQTAVMKQSVGQVGFQGGITYWMQDDNSVDLAFDFQTTSITDEAYDAGSSAVAAIAEDDGFNTFAVRARMFWNYTDDIQFVPFFEFESASRGVIWDTDADVDTDRESDKTETTSVDIALGMNHFPNEQIQIVLAAGVLLSSTDMTIQGQDTGDSNTNHVPYLKGGLDIELRDWLDLRGGVEKQLASFDSKAIAGEVTTETEASSAMFQGFLGAGLHIGDLTIDAQFNPNFFFSGPNFISGIQEPLNHRVSIVKTF